MSELFILTERPSIYLASKSPRRAELLRQIAVQFEELPLREAPGRRRDIIEVPRKEESPVEYVKRIARTKASVGWHRMGRRNLAPKPVLGADTEVILDNAIVGKPADATDAIAILKRLSGRTHEVVTAVAIRWRSQILLSLSSSRVTFGSIGDDEVQHYVTAGESLDKAGGYAVQGRAAAFVSHIDGSYSGVVGLPLYETAELLKRVGFHVL